MSIEQDIQTALNGNATLNALVSGRNYKGRVVQNPTLPYTFCARVSTIPVNHLGGSSQKINARYQVDCYASTYAGAWTLARAVKNAMESATTFKALWLDDSDFNLVEELESYRVISDFSVWFVE